MTGIAGKTGLDFSVDDVGDYVDLKPDGYLDKQVTEFGSGTISLGDPPIADADVVINSAYWLIGRDGWIAAGPVKVKPIELIGETTQMVIKALVLVALPAMVLAIGGAVMYVRRR